jgi:hypothetical protein
VSDNEFSGERELISDHLFFVRLFPRRKDWAALTSGFVVDTKPVFAGLWSRGPSAGVNDPLWALVLLAVPDQLAGRPQDVPHVSPGGGSG